jgi:hypothetical protein
MGARVLGYCGGFLCLGDVLQTGKVAADSLPDCPRMRYKFVAIQTARSNMDGPSYQRASSQLEWRSMVYRPRPRLGGCPSVIKPNCHQEVTKPILRLDRSSPKANSKTIGVASPNAMKKPSQQCYEGFARERTPSGWTGRVLTLATGKERHGSCEPIMPRRKTRSRWYYGSTLVPTAPRLQQASPRRVDYEAGSVRLGGGRVPASQPR